VDAAQREHLRDDLKGILKGELLFDDLTRSLYGTDASIFEITPLGVVVPCDEEDLQTLVRYAHEHRVPLVPRGAGSGLAGAALGAGLIVDLSVHFRRILDLRSDSVRVQAGVVLHDLNLLLAKSGRRFAPDPSSNRQCTIGGMLATNASGSRCLRHGTTRDHVLELRVVFDNGEAASVSLESRTPSEQRTGRLAQVVAQTSWLLERHADLLASTPRRTPFDRCGYFLHDVLDHDRLDFARLLVGSEGTLAFFTEATLRTIPLPAGRGAALFGFARLDDALCAAQVALLDAPSACDLLDHRLLSLVRGNDPTFAEMIPPNAQAALLVEFESDDPCDAGRRTRSLVERLRRESACLTDIASDDPKEIDQLWRLRESALPNLYALRGPEQPVPLVEDVGVPLDRLAAYLRGVQAVLRDHETSASFLVHAGTGQVHARPFVDLNDPDQAGRLRRLADDVHALALSLGGTVSSQYGTGLARTPWVERQAGPLFPLYRELKDIFDPLHILNPGKIVLQPGEEPAWPLKKPLAETFLDRPPLDSSASTIGRQKLLLAQLQWRPGEVTQELAACNGCGDCRSHSFAERMCPVFRARHDEASSPRAKVNLLRRLILEGDPRRLSADDVRAIADLCVNCKMCAHECPARVNVPKLMIETKAANVLEHGLTRADWILARTESFAAFGSAFAVLVNAGLANSMVRWLLEKLFSIARRRRLPRFSAHSFLQRAARKGWTKLLRSRKPRVAYFVDVFANYNDPTVAEAVVAVLQHQGVEVHVPPGQVGCGMAPLAQGDLDGARDAVRRNLRVFADLAREGYRIVCSEPTAAVMLRHDALNLTDDPDARLLADHVVEFTAFLAELRRDGRFRADFQSLDLTIGHHVPCHVKALGDSPAGPELLALIPGLRVETIDVSCSGMAGTFGLKAENYEISLKAGKPMLDELRRPRILAGSTECSPCRLQMEEGAGKPTFHPAQYLALAYGLMPDLARRLRQSPRKLVLT
jgi:FAD/FMN-containing dehydrogenase/Fe-S oxidoreductase